MWLLLAVPPIVASIVSYLATKNIKDLKEKLVTFWALWAAVASSLHVVLGLLPLLALAYPLLAFFTGYFMYLGLRRLADKGRGGGSQG